MNPFAERIFKVDPYEGLNPDEYPSDVHGWNEHHFLGNPDAKLAIEVGAWKGRGTIALAHNFPSATIVAIDTWLGSEEMWTNKDDPDRYGALRLRNGYPELQREFLANMIRAGLQDRVVPFPVMSEIGLSVVKSWGVRPDVVFIDASHDYQSVKRDIIAALALDPVLICGDDYCAGWPGVVKADELLPTAHKQGVTWWL